MWEPRTEATALVDAPWSDLSNVLLSGGLSDPKIFATPDDSEDSFQIPAELLILNRFGIGYPFIKAAARIAFRYGIDGRYALLRAGIISEEIWLESQYLLEQERIKARSSIKQQNWLLDQAINNLKRTLPDYSASKTFTRTQKLCFLLIASASAVLFYHGHNVLFTIGFFAASAFYTAVVLMRALMLAWYDRRVTGSQLSVSPNESDLPIYSILVPLFDEANQVEELTSHLASINWPKSKLDIKLICERDDPITIEAIHNAGLPDFFEIVIVPSAEPKTKPKALNYALPGVRGTYAVIYDAEDRPHPDQLREAHARFLSESVDLACLQAPLLIRNKDRNLITRMFFIEYLTLFNGILPVLASWGLPIPLGGTSNHFKVEVLKKTGAWDPFNVTEDADLGIRLYREGYRSSTLNLPTLEEAPPYFFPWIKQRTRWIKGWMQTIFVHNRNPIHLFTDLGLKNGAGFHLVLTSLVISALIHPFFLTMTIYELFNFTGTSPFSSWALGIGVFNLVAGYTTYGLFALMVLRKHGHGNFASQLIFVPLYWLMISLAGWRAFIHLLVKPHRWEKTPHGLEIP